MNSSCNGPLCQANRQPTDTHVATTGDKKGADTLVDKRNTGGGKSLREEVKSSAGIRVAMQPSNVETDVNTQNNSGLTVPRNATPQDYDEITGGTNVNQTNANGETRLMLATMAKAKNNVQLLLDSKANTITSDNEGATALTMAIRGRQQSIIQLLIQQSSNVTYEAALVTAVELEDVATIRSLIDGNANVNYIHRNGATVLNIAVSRENEKDEIIKLLLQSNANVNYCNGGKGETPLMTAARSGYNSKVDLLLEHKANANLTNRMEETALMFAVTKCNHDTIAQLIEHGANVNVQDHNGETPLMLAAYSGCNNKVKLLLEHGANVDSTNRTGETALIFAVNQCNHGAIDQLINCDADVNHRDLTGMTALMTAAVMGSIDSVTQLLRHQSDIHVTDTKGWTTLMYAVARSSDSRWLEISKKDFYANKKQIVQLLVDKGAMVNTVCTNDDGTQDTALVIAILSLMEQSIIQILIDAGANVAQAMDENKSLVKILSHRQRDGKLVALLSGRPIVQPSIVEKLRSERKPKRKRRRRKIPI
jgi:ankyrin repeat protein